MVRRGHLFPSLCESVFSAAPLAAVCVCSLSLSTVQASQLVVFQLDFKAADSFLSPQEGGSRR